MNVLDGWFFHILISDGSIQKSSLLFKYIHEISTIQYSAYNLSLKCKQIFWGTNLYKYI